MKYLLIIHVLCAAYSLVHTFYINKQQCIQNENCKLPKCNCDSDKIPVNITDKYRYDQLPQLIILTIDEEKLDHKSYLVIRKLLQHFRNPNGCPIKATFFLSDTYNQTSYCLARNLYELDHEIGISTLKYECPHTFCNPDVKFKSWDFIYWTEQILSMRTKLERYAGIPRGHITGFRAPLLEPASNVHYRIISSHSFLYDSSLIINDEAVLWPFTLDYQIRFALNNNGPTQSFTNLWEIPIQTFFDKEGNSCLKIWEGHCKFDRTAHGIAKFLRQNFLRAYYKNRAPFVINLLSDWLEDDRVPEYLEKSSKNSNSSQIKNKKFHANLEGVRKFISETLEYHDDVYFVTAREAIEWMKFLPNLNSDQDLNIVEQLHKHVLNDCNPRLKYNYNGKCDYLKQVTPDYNITDSTGLDEDPSTRQSSGELNEKIVKDLQSESLYINDVVSFLLLFLLFSYLFIIIYDKFISK